MSTQQRAWGELIPAAPGAPFPGPPHSYPAREAIRASDHHTAERKSLARIFAQYPRKIASRAAQRFVEICWEKGRNEADDWLGQLLMPIEGMTTVRLAITEPAMRQLAQDASRTALSALPGLAPPLLGETVRRLCEKYGVPPPLTLSRSDLKRLEDIRWWARRIRREHGRRLESASRLVNLVNRRNGQYSSDEAVARRQENLARSRDMMEAIRVVNDIGQEFSLAELRQQSISEPRNRRAELMARISGSERVALSIGFAAEFYSITCPGRMHSSLYKSGEPNPRHDGTSPAVAHKYLMRQWQKVRAKLKRDRIEYFGLRVSEPQHDGTPHMHLLLFVNPQHIGRLQKTCRRYALEVEGDEPGASTHRFKAISIDPAKGSATGYIAKYISKNIDGFGLADDGASSAKSGAVRVDAWASTWGIRQFASIGGPPVGPYRELRRLHGQLVGDTTLDAGIAAADDGDWQGYCSAQGQIYGPRSERPIQIARTWSDEPGAYGDPKGYRTIGVESGCITVPTRMRTWTIKATGFGEKGALYAGRPAVRANGGAAPAGRSPAGDGPRLARPVGVPGSSGPLESCQ